MPLARKKNGKFTYADYLTWPDDERWEIIEGVPYNMSPAPATEHQSVSLEISRQIGNYLEDKPCRVFAAPFDVRLSGVKSYSDEKTETVVQPDIVVICDNNKIDKKGCKGAPDIAVEILSPTTAYKDETEKLKLYEKHGVKEYWIVNPEAKYIMIYRLADGRYGKPDYLLGDEVLESRAVKGLKIELSRVW